jgi:predicted DNA-binding transcriptional regulator YafY
MQYQRSFEIEQRLRAVLRLVRKGRFSTPRIAGILRVSVPTVSRDLTALRQRGFDIRPERTEAGWGYTLRRVTQPAGRGHSSGVSGSGADRERGRRR